MHIQTLSWTRLPKSLRDSRLLELGLGEQKLEAIRSKEPRKRILEAARLAFTIDDEPNSDLIEYIAGYESRSGLYHYFRNMKELLETIGEPRIGTSLPKAIIEPSRLDVSAVIPRVIENYPVHLDDRDNAKRVIVWQKVNGGMRSILISRTVPRISFLTGILLYAGEGTKSMASTKVEIANSSPNILRLFAVFLNDLEVSKMKMTARVQIHHPEEASEAREYWEEQLGLESKQFKSPLVSSPKREYRKHTYTLQLSYANTMLLMLLRAWTTDLEDMIRLVGHPR